MAALQKFKTLATQCGTARSPSSNSSTKTADDAAASPSCRHRHRRRTALRKLLKSSPSRELLRPGEPPAGKKADLAEKRKGSVSCTLGDLFVSSLPTRGSDGGGRVFPETGRGGSSRRLGLEGLRDGVFAARGGAAALRVGSGGLRYRLLRRVWRPVLVPIPE